MSEVMEQENAVAVQDPLSVSQEIPPANPKPENKIEKKKQWRRIRRIVILLILRKKRRDGDA